MNRWLQMIADDPEHSVRYIERFRALAADGADLDGEARFVDAMAPRGARILDAGCGPGRVGGRLFALGHTVVGVDIDPTLVAAAEHDHPGPRWLIGDLATLDLASMGVEDPFDVVVCAGNVMAFVDPATRVEVLRRLGAHLGEQGRLVIGFGAGRDYAFDEFFVDVSSAGLRVEVQLSTWHLHAFTPSSDFLVAVVSRSV